jgi:hypothetical protein
MGLLGSAEDGYHLNRRLVLAARAGGDHTNLPHQCPDDSLFRRALARRLGVGKPCAP